MPPTQRQCPSCRTVYAGDEKSFCPRDGTRLLEMSAPKTPEDPFLGRVIAGRFVLERRLGKGGMGVVYLASHNVLKRPFAVKLLLREYVTSERALSRFFRESRVASSVDHPNIVSIYDFGQTDKGEPYLVMEYVEGTGLYQLMQKSRDRRLSPAYAVHILAQVARALEHAHKRGVVHRDIKPENILLTTHNGQTDWVKVLDFGVARIVGQPPLTRIGEEIIGTPEFMAPEMMSSSEVAPAVDLYSLGIMLHDTIAGSPPFRGDVRDVLHGHLHVVPPRLSERRKDAPIPAELDELTARLLEKDPSLRPSAEETVARLERIATLLPPHDAPIEDQAQHEGPVSTGSGQHTVILPGGSGSQQGAELQGAQTMVLPASVAPAAALQAADPKKRAEIAALQAELSLTSLRLGDEAYKLCSALWPHGWPEPARALRQKITDWQKADEHATAKAAALRQRQQEQQQYLDEERQALRQKILSLSERLQVGKGLPDDEAKELRQRIEESERGLARVLQNGPSLSTAIDVELAALAEEQRGLRENIERGFSDLARLALTGAAGSRTNQEAARSLEQLQEKANAARAMLGLLLRSASPG